MAIVRSGPQGESASSSDLLRNAEWDSAIVLIERRIVDSGPEAIVCLKEIARALDLGLETVKWHLKSVFAKLNAGSFFPPHWGAAPDSRTVLLSCYRPRTGIGRRGHDAQTDADPFGRGKFGNCNPT